MMVVTFNKLPDMLSKEEFPFLYNQLAKNPALANNKFTVKMEDRPIWYLCLENRTYEEIGHPTVHVVDLEVAVSRRGCGLLREIMDYIPDGNVSLQANSDSLVELYKKYGFKTCGENNGNLMLRIQTT